MVKRISIIQAKEMLQKEGTVLVDIRDSESYALDHDPRALHLTEALLPQFLQQTGKETNILILCYHGNSSQMVAQYLFNEGFVNAYSIDGGYEMWKLNKDY